MCERINGELVVCMAAKRRMAAMLAPVQMAMIPLSPIVRASKKEKEPQGDGSEQLWLIEDDD